MSARRSNPRGEDGDTLEAALRSLRGYEPIPTRAAREEVWGRLERGATRGTSWRLALPLAATAALAAVLGLSLRPTESAPRPGPGRVWVRAGAIVMEDGHEVAAGSILSTRARAEIQSERLLVVTEPGARLRILDVPPAPPSLEILAGAVEVELSPTVWTELHLGAARMRLLGQRVELSTSAEGTTVVARGSMAQLEAEGTRTQLREDAPLLLRPPAPAAPADALPKPAAVRVPAEALSVPSPASPVREVPKAPELAPAPRPTPPLAEAAPSPEQQLDRADRVVASDSARAESLAREVLERAPSPTVEARALAILADARRRQGAKAEASAIYRQVAEHESGGPYAEEALYQAARLYFEMRRTREALVVSREADARFPRGPLAPERHVLEAEVHWAAGDRAKAKAALVRGQRAAEEAQDQASAERIGARLRALERE